MENKTTQRSSYFDLLRILATLAVIMLHVAAANWYDTDVTTYPWKVMNIADSIVRWGVPVFVMISGALFLNPGKPVSVGKLYGKNILRLFTALVFWSGLYALRAYQWGMIDVMAWKAMIRGHYHMWFMYMIIGLYLAIPIFRQIAASKKTALYFVILGMVLSVIIPGAFMYLGRFWKYNMGFLDEFQAAFNSMQLHVPVGYCFYFMLGHYLASYEMKGKWRAVIYVLGIVGFAATAILADMESVRMNRPDGWTYGEFTPNVMVTAVFMFVAAKYGMRRIKIGPRVGKCLQHLSKYSFGVYLMHVFIIDYLWAKGIHSLSWDPIVSIIATTALTGAVGYVISAVLNHIPILRKYIV